MDLPYATPQVRTTCPYCGVGCGVLAQADGAGGTVIVGDPMHPANFGRLCSKGTALGETLSFDGRLLNPMMRGADGALTRTSWDAALNRVAAGFRAAIDQHGPDAVALYVSGQMLTEDYYVANKLMKGFIGSANIDTNSRLCMASSVAGHKRAFGSDTVPGCYEDLDQADLAVLVGSNAAWCHPILHQRIVRNKRERGARIVVIDPRRTPTADEADLYLQIAPGTDSVLFCGLLVHLADADAIDTVFIRHHTRDFDESLACARRIAPDIDTVARGCGVPREHVACFFDWFCATPKAVTLFSQGVNQAAQGTDKVNAIINCHLATNRIGRPGMGPFSLTGQPNAMGGREVGGLANQLAAHMGLNAESVDRVRRFWNAPAITTREGLKAVDLFDAVADGRIKALWVMGTNPAVSLPRADAVRGALAALDLFVVSDVVAATDTIDAAPHVLLPAAAWGEKDGTVTNSERRISRQRSFIEPPGEARPDWWIVAQVGRHLGFGKAFDYRFPADVFREHARLSAFENEATRDFDLSGLANISDDAYLGLEPVQWPVRDQHGAGQARMLGDGRFYTTDGRARFISVEEPRLAAQPDKTHAFLLNTGRVRDHWHTMTRTGRSPRLSAHIDEPFVDVHPDDAAAAGLADGDFAEVSSPHGKAMLRVRSSEGQRRGELFAPIHWNGETASLARIGSLVHAVCDRHSGQPDLKATPVAIAPASFAFEGFMLSRAAVTLPQDFWWARATVESGIATRLAANIAFDGLAGLARRLLGDDGAILEFHDNTRQVYRAARVCGDRLEACLWLAPGQKALPGSDWLKRQLAQPRLDEASRRALLAGRPPEGAADCGPMVCACFGVGRTTIERLIVTGAAVTVESVGTLLKAGTNCGSCQPEIRRLISSNGGRTLEATA